MAWFRKPQYTPLRPTPPRDRVPEGLWFKCSECVNLIYRKDFEANLRVCPKCGFHHKMSAEERIAMLADEGSFTDLNPHVLPTDSLKFRDSKPYSQRLKQARKNSGLTEAVRTGRAKIGGHGAMLSVMDFGFIGGSMGSVVGERTTRLFEQACEERLPVVSVATSGGARMQESILSLMQMAKTSAKLAQLSDKALLYVSVMTHPTTGGVSASFSMLGDINLAEPNALIGFAGPRIIKETLGKDDLPEGFQRAESLLKHGFIDRVVPRTELKETLSYFIEMLAAEPEETGKKDTAGRDDDADN